MHDLAFPLLVALIIVALAFDFLNGLHDAANSIATVVSTQLLSPVAAVVFAAAGNFLAYWIVGLHVAETVHDATKPNEVTGSPGTAERGTPARRPMASSPFWAWGVWML